MPDQSSASQLLDWLVEIESSKSGEHFSWTPVGGRTIANLEAGFDQQPLEAWAMIDAASVAALLDGPHWLEVGERGTILVSGSERHRRQEMVDLESPVPASMGSRGAARTAIEGPNQRWRPLPPCREPTPGPNWANGIGWSQSGPSGSSWEFGAQTPSQKKQSTTLFCQHWEVARVENQPVSRPGARRCWI